MNLKLTTHKLNEMDLGNTYGKLISTLSPNFSFGVKALLHSALSQLTVLVYICEIFYVLTISLVKISILIFYLRVFPTQAFRVRCWAVIAFIAAGSIAFMFATIFQCSPISFVFNKNLHGGKCVNFNTATWVNGAFNIFQDLLIIALPISEVRKLQLEVKKKISLYIMFALGGSWVSPCQS